MNRRGTVQTNTDASLFEEALRADAFIHETLHRLLVRPTVELVALLVIVAACTVSDFPLAEHMDFMFIIGIIVGVHRKRKVLIIANAVAFTA